MTGGGGSHCGAQARLAALRGDLRAGLSALPAPANEYLVQIPEAPDAGDGDDDGMVEDAADVKARLKVRASLKRRS